MPPYFMSTTLRLHLWASNKPDDFIAVEIAHNGSPLLGRLLTAGGEKKEMLVKTMLSDTFIRVFYDSENVAFKTANTLSLVHLHTL